MYNQWKPDIGDSASSYAAPDNNLFLSALWDYSTDVYVHSSGDHGIFDTYVSQF